MRSNVFSVLLLAAGAFAQFTINTPQNVVECEPILLTWTGGVSPYFLSILPGGNPSAAAIEDLGQQTGTSLTWVANIASGTSLGLTLRDSTGATVSSAPFTIQPGSSSSCLTSAGGATGSSTTTGTVTSTTIGAITTTTAPGGATTSTTSTSTHTSVTTTTSGSSSTTTSKSGAVPTARFQQVGVAGVLGAVIAAIVV